MNSLRRVTGVALAFLSTLLLIFTCACSAGKAKGLAEDGVTRFHSQLNSGQFREIYSGASEAFRKSDTETGMTDFFSAIHRKLGNAKNADQQSFFVNFTTSGTMVTLTYRTVFENDTATEQFVWKVEDQPLLVSYRIDSRALITK